MIRMPPGWAVTSMQWKDAQKAEVLIEANDGNTYISPWPVRMEYYLAVSEYLKEGQIGAPA